METILDYLSGTNVTTKILINGKGRQEIQRREVMTEAKTVVTRLLARGHGQRNVGYFRKLEKGKK